MRKVLSVTAVVAAIAAVAATVVAGVSSPPGSHECAEATQRCEGRVDVPLDHADPGRGTISVAFAWFPRRDRSKPAEGTVLAVSGGPAPALPMAEVYQRALGPVLDRQDLLMIDPRGLGQSSPLLCPGLDLAVQGTIAECGRTLGQRVGYFGTDQAVADFDAVRAALGVERVSVYGTSYGTVWGHAYAVRFPSRVRSVLLDSVVRFGDDGYVRWPLGRPVWPGMENLDAVCRPSRDCRALPGTPPRVWGELVERLRSVPDRAVPLAALLRVPQATVEPAVGAEVNAAAVAYLAGDPLPLRRLVRTFVQVGGREHGGGGGGGGGGPDPSAAGYLAYLCADAAYPYDRAAAPERKRRQLAEAYATQRPFRPFTADEVQAATGGDQHQWCVDWPTSRPSPPLPAGAVYPAVPMLAVGGELDVATTGADAEAMARRFPRGRAVVVPFGGHNPALGPAAGMTGPYWACAQEVVRGFLTDPQRPVERCSAANYRASGGFARRATQVRGDVAGVRGADRRLVAATVATAADAAARRNPNGAMTGRLTGEPGLRGGRLTLPAPGRADLDQVRYVEDVAVSGSVTIDPGGTARADLTAVGPDGHSRALTLTWEAFRHGGPAEATGTLDARPFRVRL
ncbi:alpha/beta fold hydrolase [Amycolatopsis suaedae]|uniref:Alpha/beta fold hydrolase n=1 Tax=Amycolatopsis suaedae TaxID=2510978 RepID=A0A4Q7J1K6_9PSEU|nr:alpha/beta fold hydrolase [Amycolatopsis suaedae]RZQ60717.1 alpha/beta fold hydrolase [Amycolatopsis suaedae]